MQNIIQYLSMIFCFTFLQPEKSVIKSIKSIMKIGYDFKPIILTHKNKNLVS